MGHTNSTANLSLPQFIGTDKPTWLGDVNGAFSTIDSKVGTIDADISAVDAKADNAVADASNAVTTATNANNTAGTASTTATNALNVANNALTVANNADGHTNQLETKIGLLADLTTTDKTSIVNAINEVNAGLGGSTTAAQVSYDNSGSGLVASNVQDAIDELAQGGGVGETVEVTADGVKTRSQLLDALFALVDNTKVSVNAKIEVPDISNIIRIGTLTKRSLAGYQFSWVVNDNSNIASNTVELLASSSKISEFYGTYSDYSSNVPTSGLKITLHY